MEITRPPEVVTWKACSVTWISMLLLDGLGLMDWTLIPSNTTPNPNP